MRTHARVYARENTDPRTRAYACSPRSRRATAELRRYAFSRRRHLMIFAISHLIRQLPLMMIFEMMPPADTPFSLPAIFRCQMPTRITLLPAMFCYRCSLMMPIARYAATPAMPPLRIRQRFSLRHFAISLTFRRIHISRRRFFIFTAILIAIAFSPLLPPFSIPLLSIAVDIFFHCSLPAAASRLAASLRFQKAAFDIDFTFADDASSLSPPLIEPPRFHSPPFLSAAEAAADIIRRLLRFHLLDVSLLRLSPAWPFRQIFRFDTAVLDR